MICYGERSVCVYISKYFAYIRILINVQADTYTNTHAYSYALTRICADSDTHTQAPNVRAGKRDIGLRDANRTHPPALPEVELARLVAARVLPGSFEEQMM